MHGFGGTRAVDCGRDLAGDQQGSRSSHHFPAICCGVLMFGRKLAIPSTGFRTSRRAMDEPVAKVVQTGEPTFLACRINNLRSGPIARSNFQSLSH
jgi:hypothetical protein